MDKRKLTIGEEVSMEYRAKLVKAWLCDIAIVVVTFVLGGMAGYYLGHFVIKP